MSDLATWRPIKTAPEKDGRYLVTTDGRGVHTPKRLIRPMQYVMYYEKQHGEWMGFGEGNITHWMPLPEPPK